MVDYGLKAKRLYKKHFPKFGPTIIKSCTYKFVKPVTYTPSTGDVTQPLPVDDQPLDVIFVDAEDVKVDDEPIRLTDKVAMFPSLNLLQNAEVGDKIYEGSNEWKVLTLLSDPADAGWELLVRPRIIS